MSEETFKKNTDDLDDDILKLDDEDDDQDFIKLGEESKESKINSAFRNLVDDLQDVKQKISEFLSKKNQQRNLDRETGGFEAEEQRESSEKDVWDDRSEDVDKMGATDTFNTTSMKSVVWTAKKNRLKAKKHSKEAAQEGAEALLAGGVGANLIGGEKKLTMTDRLKLRQDLSHEKSGGEVWR
jgi:hypothetical protein